MDLGFISICKIIDLVVFRYGIKKSLDVSKRMVSGIVMVISVVLLLMSLTFLPVGLNSKFRARLKTINLRLKNFNFLYQKIRHD